MHKTFILSLAGILMLTGCDSLYPPTPRPDYTIKVVQTPNGPVAVPPECPPWSSATIDPYDNQPLPQFGCATARNLALMVDHPDDLVKGRDLGNANAVVTVGAMRRYENNQTRGLIKPSGQADDTIDITTAGTSTSTLTGNIVSGSPSSSSSSAAPAAGP